MAEVNFDTTSTQKDLRKFLLGAILGAAIFLIVAGVAEIAIAREEQCHRENERIRLAPNKYEVCLPEWESYFLRATSRGAVWTFNNDAPPMVGWIVMVLFFGLLGGFCTRLPRFWGVLAYLGVGLAAIAIFAGFGYVLQFIVY